MAFRDRCLKTPQVGVLKVGVLDVGFKPFAPQGKAGSGSSLLIIWHLAWVVVYRESVSQSFLPISMWVFSHLPNV